MALLSSLCSCTANVYHRAKNLKDSTVFQVHHSELHTYKVGDTVWTTTDGEIVPRTHSLGLVKAVIVK